MQSVSYLFALCEQVVAHFLLEVVGVTLYNIAHAEDGDTV